MENTPSSPSPKTSPLAIAALICGLLGFLGLPSVLGIVLGILAIREINSSEGTLTGQGLAFFGLAAGTMFMVAATVLMVIYGITGYRFYQDAKSKSPTQLASQRDSRQIVDKLFDQANPPKPKPGPLTPAQAAKSNRIKCANNLATIAKAYHSMSQDIDGSTPHLYGAFAGRDGNQLAMALGYQDLNDPWECKQWLNAYAIRQGLQGYATLVSPLDKQAIAVMRRNPIKTLDEYREKTDISHDPKQMSYAIAMQGDVKAFETVLALTRNVADADATMRQNYIRQAGGHNDPEIWKYPNEDRAWDKHGAPIAHFRGKGNRQYDSQFTGSTDTTTGIPGFPNGQANWVLASGSVIQGGKADFNTQLENAEASYPQGDAITLGLNLILLRPTQ